MTHHPHPLYCNAPCIDGDDERALSMRERAQREPSACPSTPGAGALPQTPRGGQNRRPGGANKTGAPLRARESKNPDPFRGAYLGALTLLANSGDCPWPAQYPIAPVRGAA